MGHFSLFVNGARWKMVNLFLVWTPSTIHLSVNGFSRWGHFHSGVECWVHVAQPQMNVRQWSTFIPDIEIKMTHSTWLATQSQVSWRPAVLESQDAYTYVSYGTILGGKTSSVVFCCFLFIFTKAQKISASIKRSEKCAISCSQSIMTNYNVTSQRIYFACEDKRLWVIN
jgi:hypothetical protein